MPTTLYLHVPIVVLLLNQRTLLITPFAQIFIYKKRQHLIGFSIIFNIYVFV